jgi:Protein of unknown function (DUF3311)
MRPQGVALRSALQAAGEQDEGAEAQLLLRGGRVRMTRPSVAALLLALIPFAALCFSVPLWDRVEPMVLGLPFNLFWLIAWIVLSSLCMWGAYRVEAARHGREGS